jgi:tetratricopeptide (TPR) repeat protein
MKSKSKVKDFLEGQLSDKEEQMIMDQLYRYEFEQLLAQELTLHKANALTDRADSPAHTPIILALPMEIPPKRKSLIQWGVAASILLALIMVPLMRSNPTHSNSLANAHSFEQFIDKQPMPNLIVTLGNPKGEAEIRQLAKSSYKTENYQKAAAEYQQLVETERCTKEDCFYGALSFMAKQNPTPNYEKAIHYLKKAITLSKGWKSDEMHFYLAIALYKNKQLKDAKDLFEQIANHPGEYQAQVKENLKNFPIE